MTDPKGHRDPPPTHNGPSAAAKERELAQQARLSREGNVPTKAVQEQEQMREAVLQKGEADGIGLNEGGRTNDSRAQENPPGAVHGLPAPSLKGTWR